MTTLTPERRAEIIRTNAVEKEKLLQDMALRRERQELLGEFSYQPPEAPTPPTPRPVAPNMQERALAQWETLLDAKIRANTEMVLGMIGDEIGEFTGKMQKSLSDRLDDLERRVSDIENELDARRSTSWFGKKAK